MFKGKYVLISMNELKEKISDYLKVNYNLVNNNDDSVDNSCNMILEIEKSDIVCEDIKTLISKIVGEDVHLIDDLVFNFKHADKIVLDMTKCTYMFKKLFEINENISFDDEVMLANEDEDIYLFYLDLN